MALGRWVPQSGLETKEANPLTRAARAASPDVGRAGRDCRGQGETTEAGESDLSPGSLGENASFPTVVYMSKQRHKFFYNTFLAFA